MLLKKRKKKKRKTGVPPLAAYQYTFWMLMLDDYTIEELSSDEFDNMKRFQEKQTSLDLSRRHWYIIRRKEKSSHTHMSANS